MNIKVVAKIPRTQRLGPDSADRTEVVIGRLADMEEANASLLEIRRIHNALRGEFGPHEWPRAFSYVKHRIGFYDSYCIEVE